MLECKSRPVCVSLTQTQANLYVCSGRKVAHKNHTESGKAILIPYDGNVWDLGRIFEEAYVNSPTIEITFASGRASSGTALAQ